MAEQSFEKSSALPSLLSLCLDYSNSFKENTQIKTLTLTA